MKGIFTLGLSLFFLSAYAQNLNWTAQRSGIT